MCISVMCVEVGRAAGLIRSSQLFPPSLSSRSLEYCAVRLSHNPSLRRLQLQKLPSSLRRTLNAHNKPGLEKFLELVYETFEVFSH